MSLKIFQRKDRGGGGWTLMDRWRGTSLSKKYATREEAEAELAKRRRLPLERLRQEQAHLPAEGKAPLFSPYALHWLDEQVGLGRICLTTIENHRSALTQHFIPAFADLRLDEIPQAMIRALIAKKRQEGVRFPDRGLKVDTLQTYRASLKAVFDQAVDDGLIASNPVPKSSKLFPRKVSKEPDPFDAHELGRAFQALDTFAEPKLRVLYRVWLGAGSREGEILGTRDSDFDLRRGLVTLSKGWTRRRLQPRTKTRRNRTSSFLHPVSVPGAGWKPLAPQASPVLAALRALPRPLDADAHVFSTPTGKPFSPSTVLNTWRGPAGWPASGTVPPRTCGIPSPAPS